MIGKRQKHRDPGLAILRAIGVFKLSKAALLLATAYGVLRLQEPAVIAGLYNWAAALPSGLEQEGVQRGLAFISGLSPARIKALGFVSVAYAAVFTTEGVGLWLGRRWAEWLTVILTSSLIPLEIWEFFRRPGSGRAMVIVANAVIVWYLARQLRRKTG